MLKEQVSTGTVLKALLEQRHSAEYRAFRRDYARHARTASPEMQPPARATFYRWLSGEIGTLPYPGHRRVLAAMFPDWDVDELFGPYEPGIPLERSRDGRAHTVAQPGHLAGVTDVFQNRPSFLQEYSPGRLFDTAVEVDAAGISHNLLFQQYPDPDLRALLGRARLRLLFLDPDGESITARNREEGHASGHLAEWTRVNLQVLAKAADSLPAAARERLQVRLYDETVRFQVMLIDAALGIMQPYLPSGRGLDSPTFVMRPLTTPGVGMGVGAGVGTGLYGTYQQVFESMWARATEADLHRWLPTQEATR